VPPVRARGLTPPPRMSVKCMRRCLVVYLVAAVIATTVTVLLIKLQTSRSRTSPKSTKQPATATIARQKSQLTKTLAATKVPPALTLSQQEDGPQKIAADSSVNKTAPPTETSFHAANPALCSDMPQTLGNVMHIFIHVIFCFWKVW
jgi:hypothetical protein